MRLTPNPLPVEHLSASSIAKLLVCPEQYRMRYIKKQKERLYADRFVGLVDHALWEAYWKTGGVWDQGWARSAYKGMWDGMAEKEQPDLTNDDEAKLKATGEKMIDAYFPVAEIIQPLAVEQRFEEKIPGIPVPIIGYVDVWCQHKIIDRKTSKKKETKPKPDWRLQASIYSLVGDQPVDVHIVTKQVTPKVYCLPVDTMARDVTVQTIQRAYHVLEDCWNRYGPDRTWPTNGMTHTWACDFCSFGPKYNNTCPVWSDQ